MGEEGEGGEVVEVEFFHEFGAVIFDGLGAEFEGEGDGFGGVAFGEELEDFALAGG